MAPGERQNIRERAQYDDARLVIAEQDRRVDIGPGAQPMSHVTSSAGAQLIDLLDSVRDGCNAGSPGIIRLIGESCDELCLKEQYSDHTWSIWKLFGES